MVVAGQDFSLLQRGTDAVPPTLSIKAPIANQRWSNALFTAQGTAADNRGITNVWYQFNFGTWSNATTTNRWTNWTATLGLTPGSNILRAYAWDSSANSSATNTVWFSYVVTNALHLEIVGKGTVTGATNGQVLEVGRNYTITAVPAAGLGLSNWLGGTTLPLNVLTNRPVLQFTMASNLTLEAVFGDTNRPVLAITNIASGMRVSNAVFEVAGWATDNVAVASVQLQFNGGIWTNPIGTRNWSAPLNLTPGTNTVAAYAVDTSGNFSVTNRVNFDFVVTNQLAIRATGLGRIAPNYSNAWLEIGRDYNITSTPAAGFVLTNWIVSTNWIGGASFGRTNLQFMMASNLTLQANFVDVTRPILTIAAPKAGQRMPNAMAAVSGTASDNWQVAGVWYQLNGGPWSVAPTTNNWTNWSQTLTLIAGTNTVNAYAIDLAGNDSLTKSVSFVSSNTFRLQLGFNAANPVAPNGLAFNLEVSTNLSGHIQYSTNLIDWLNLTNFNGTNSTLHFRDAAATNSIRRFYRATVP
jgi:hypothetical protein